MRFNLRVLFALVVSIATVPILATSITFFFHEGPVTDNEPVALWIGRDLYVQTGRGSMFIVSPDSVKFSTQLYLRIRQVFLPPHASDEVVALLQKARTESNRYRWEKVVFGKEKIEVAKDIHADKWRIEMRTEAKTLTTSLGERENWSVGMHPDNICVTNGNQLILAFRTPTESYLVSSMNTTIISPSTWNRAGKFFFNTMLALSSILLALFLWRILRFHRQTKSPAQTPATPSPSCL